MNNIQGGDVTCYICEVQALAPQFSNSPWTGSTKPTPFMENFHAKKNHP